MTKYQLKGSTLLAIVWIAFYYGWTAGAYGEDANKSAQTRLRIVGFFPAHDSPIWPGGFYCIPAALLATEQINNNSAKLLPGYKLDFEYFDSGGCDRVEAVERYLKEIASQPTPPVAIIGPGCSESALALATFSAQPGRESLMVSYGASTLSLSNLVAFPYFLRTVNSQKFMGLSMAEFVTYFNWKAIATVYEDGLIQRSTVLTFHASLSRKDAGINLSSTHRLSIPNDDVNEQTEDLLVRTLEQIKHRRIIFAFVHKAVGRCLMLQAARRRMVYPSYVWVFPQLLGKWWVLECSKNESADRECTAIYNVSCEDQQELINQTVDGAFHFLYHLNQSSDISVIESGLTLSQYEDELTIRTNDFVDAYKQMNNDKNVSYGSTNYASATYDAVWAVALGLAVAEQKLQSVNLSLADHAENVAYVSEVLHSSILNNVSFIGASGNVSFNSHGTVETPVEIKQLQRKAGGEGQDVHHMDIGLFLVNEGIQIDNASLYWNVLGESQPTDSFPPKYITLTTVNVTLLVVVLLLTLFVLVANCGIAFVNYYFRDEKHVKPNSPSLNNFIFSGHFCIILYVVAFTIVSSVSHLEDIYYGILCNLLPWTLSVGYSLVNGTIFWKSWRLYKIFSAKFELKQASWLNKLHDRHLIVGIAAIVFVSDIVPLISFTVWTPLHKMVLERRSENQLMEIFAPVCALSFKEVFHSYLTIGVMLSLKVVLLVFVTFSALMLLKAKIPKSMELYNDSGQVFTFSLLQGLVLVVLFFTLLMYKEDDYVQRLYVMYTVLTLGPLSVVAFSLWCFVFKYRKLCGKLRKCCHSKENYEVFNQSSDHHFVQRASLSSMNFMQWYYDSRFSRRSWVSRWSSSSVSSTSFTSPNRSNTTSVTSIGSQ